MFLSFTLQWTFVQTSADAGHRSDFIPMSTACERKCTQVFLQNTLGRTILAPVATLLSGKAG